MSLVEQLRDLADSLDAEAERIHALPRGGFWYLATPYSKYPEGLQSAFDLALDALVLLNGAGFPVFSPIVHTHPVAMRGRLDPFDHNMWMDLDRPFMDTASGLIILQATGWKESIGMKIEADHFRQASKPICHMMPGVVPCLDR